jgi:hypothetical protein
MPGGKVGGTAGGCSFVTENSYGCYQLPLMRSVKVMLINKTELKLLVCRVLQKRANIFGCGHRGFCNLGGEDTSRNWETRKKSYLLDNCRGISWETGWRRGRGWSGNPFHPSPLPTQTQCHPLLCWN